MALDTVNTARLSVQITWDVAKTVTGFNGVRSNEAITRVIAFTKGVTADAIDEVYSAVLTVNASTTTDFDLSANLTNVVNSAAVTIASIKLIFVELLTATDTDPASTVIGSAASSITVLGDANSPLVLVDPSDKVTLGNGDCFLLTRRSAAGIDVAGGGTTDVLQIQNNDGAVAAKVRVTLFCGSTN